jgi:hypothetical protein
LNRGDDFAAVKAKERIDSAMKARRSRIRKVVRVAQKEVTGLLQIALGQTRDPEARQTIGSPAGTRGKFAQLWNSIAGGSCHCPPASVCALARILKTEAINPGAETNQRFEGHRGYPGA